MSINDINSQNRKELSEDKRVLLEQLLTVFDYKTAIDFIFPKTHETRHQLTIEDLNNVITEQDDDRLQRLRSMEHYQTTTQSLARADLEASYQAFLRSQVGQEHVSHDELELFIRNSADIDVAKRIRNSTNDLSLNPLESHLLFHSSKLNEERAKLLKSASSKQSLRQINDNLTLHNYFPETVMMETKSRNQKKKTEDKQEKLNYPRSMQIEHGEKKVRVHFVKDSNAFQKYPTTSFRSKSNRNLFLTQQKNIEALFDGATSRTHGHSETSNTSNIHREIFPPLSMAALREYRPTFTPKSYSASTTDTQRERKLKAMTKTDFLWDESIVTRKHN